MKPFLMMLLMSLLGFMGCTPAQNEGVTVTLTPEVMNADYSSVELDERGYYYGMEGDRMVMPISVQNVSAADLQITTMIESETSGFVTNDTEFSLTSGSSKFIVVEFDSVGMNIEIGRSEERTARVVITTNEEEVHQVFLTVTLFNASDYMGQGLNIWNSYLSWSTTAGDDPVVKNVTVSSPYDWAEAVTYTATVEGDGRFEILSGTGGTLEPGSQHQIVIQFSPPATVVGDGEEFIGMLTVTGASGDETQVFLRAESKKPDEPTGDDDDSASGQ